MNAEETISQLQAELEMLRDANLTLKTRNEVLEAQVTKYKMGFVSPKSDPNGASPHDPLQMTHARKSAPYPMPISDEPSANAPRNEPIQEANSSDEEFEIRNKRQQMSSDDKDDVKNQSQDPAQNQAEVMEMPPCKRRVSVPAPPHENDHIIENYEEKREEATPTPGTDHDFSMDPGLCGPSTPREDQEVASPHGIVDEAEAAADQPPPEQREPQGIGEDEPRPGKPKNSLAALTRSLEQKVGGGPKESEEEEEQQAPLLMVPRGDEDPEAQSANVSPTKSFGAIPSFPASPTTGRQTPVQDGPLPAEKPPSVEVEDDLHEKRSPRATTIVDKQSKPTLETHSRPSHVVDQYSSSPPPEDSPIVKPSVDDLQFPDIPVVPAAPALLTNDDGPEAYDCDLIARVRTDELDDKSKEKLDTWCDEIMVTCNVGLHDDSEKINIFTSKKSSLMDLKKEVEKRHPNCPVDKQHVVMGGQEITQNDKSLDTLGFDDGSTCIVVVSGMQSPTRRNKARSPTAKRSGSNLDSAIRELDQRILAEQHLETGESSPPGYKSNDLDFSSLKSDLAHVGASITDPQAEEYRKEAEDDHPVWRLAPPDDTQGRSESVHASESSIDEAGASGMWPAREPENDRAEPGAPDLVERNSDTRRGSMLVRKDPPPGEPRVDLFNPSPEPSFAKSDPEPAPSMGSSMPLSSGPSPNDAEEEEGVQDVEELGQEDEPVVNMEGGGGPGAAADDVEELFASPEAALQPPPGALVPSVPGALVDDAMVVGQEEDDDIEDLEGEPLVTPVESLERWGLNDKMLHVRRHINEAGNLYSEFVTLHEYDKESGRLRFPEKPIVEVAQLFKKLIEMIRFDDRGFETLPLYMIKKRVPTNREIDRLFVHNPESRLHRTLMENKTKSLQGTTVLVVGLGPAALLLGIQLAIAGATVEFISKEYAGGNAKVYSGLEVIPILPELLEHLRSLGVSDLLPYLDLDLEKNPQPAIPCAVLQHALIRVALVLGCRLYPTIEFVSMNNNGQIRCTTSTTGYRTVVRNMSKKTFNVIADSTGVVRDCRVNGQPLIGTKKKVKSRFHCGLLAQFGSNPGEMAVKEFPLKSLANSRDCHLFDEKDVYLSHISYLRTPFSHYVSGVFSKDLSKYGLTKTSLTVAPNGFMSSSEQHIVERLGRDIRSEWRLPKDAEFDMLQPGQLARAGGGADRSDSKSKRSKRKTKAVSVFHFRDTVKPKAYLCSVQLKSKSRTMVLLVGDAAISTLWQIGNSSNHGCMSALAGSDVLSALLPKLKTKPHNAEEYIESARKSLALRIKDLEAGRLLPRAEVYKRRPI